MKWRAKARPSATFRRRPSESDALAIATVKNAALMHDMRQLELAFDSVPSILISFSPVGEIELWNAAAERTFGLRLEQVRGKRLSDCGVEWLGSVNTIDMLFSPEMHGKRSDHPFQLAGRKRWLGLSLCHVQTEDENSAFLLTASDITDRRELEEQNRQTHKLEAIGQLAAGIAHEINTPTQYVGDNITFLRDGWQGLSRFMQEAKALRAAVPDGTAAAFDEAVQQADLDFLLPEFPLALDQAYEGIQRISHIVAAMKEFSHPGSKEKSEVDVNHTVETSIVLARSEWKYVAEVVTHFDPLLPPVGCYSGEISQVILNLLVNAAHSIQEKQDKQPGCGMGTIRVETRQNRGGVEVLITDSGMGIPEEVRPRMFELFFTTKEVGKGTGQGLAFAHSVIVKKHGGDLWFDSELGLGTTFGFRLPLVPGTQLGTGSQSEK